MSGGIAMAWLSGLRITILRLLEGLPGRAANESILTDSVRDFGIMASRDQVVGQIAWLAEAGLVIADEIGGLTLATITKRGVDVAQGIATHPGVKRPAPKA